MFIPAITPQDIRNRMTKVWALANALYHKNAFIGASYWMKEYDYLSNYQRDDSVVYCSS